MELKDNAFLLLVGEGIAITHLGPFPGEFGQIVRLQLDAVETVVTTQFFDLLLRIFLAHDHLAVLITCEFIEEILFRELLAIRLHRTEVLWDGKFRHDGVGVNAIGLHFVNDLLGVFKCLRDIAENGSHLSRCLEPFLLGIVHAGWVVEILSRAKADEAVMRFGMFLFHKMHVIGGNNLGVGLASQVKQHLIYLFLTFIHRGIAPRLIRLMALQLNIIVISKQVLEPHDGLPGAHHVAIHDLLRQFATQTGRTANEPLVIFLKQAVVDTRIIVETVGIGDGA